MATKKIASKAGESKANALGSPTWLTENIAKYQKDSDARAADDLRIYEQNVSQWIVNNVHNRDIGQPISTAPAIPMVVTWYDGGGFMASKSAPNPLAKPAVLPPPVATAPDNPAFGGTSAGTKDMEMFRLLYAIAAKLGV